MQNVNTTSYGKQLTSLAKSGLVYIAITMNQHYHAINGFEGASTFKQAQVLADSLTVAHDDEIEFSVMKLLVKDGEVYFA